MKLLIKPLYTNAKKNHHLMLINKKNTIIPVIPLLTAGAGMIGCSSPEAGRPQKPNDKITWNVEVLEDGWFDAEIHYTCPPEDAGSTFELSFGNSAVTGKITEGHDPPLRGMENDRIERQESYVKDFKPLHIGRIFLEQGKGLMTLQAIDMPGSQVMDFRLMMLKRAD